MPRRCRRIADAGQLQLAGRPRLDAGYGGPFAVPTKPVAMTRGWGSTFGARPADGLRIHPHEDA